MIRIYEKTETDFNHNGLCVLDSCIKCEVEEELNGIYKLELEYPLDNRDRWLNIIEGNVLKVPTPMGTQLFRIFKKKKNLNSISCIAFHIFYDLIDNFIEDTRPTISTGASAIEDIFKGTQYKHRFQVNSDISRVNTAYIIRKNPVEALLSDDEQSFLNRWGGEIVRDNFSISMKAHRGEDRGVSIRYGKNLIGLEEEIDESNVITRIMPTGLEENDTVIMLPEKYIDSPLINKYVYPKIKHFHFGEFRVNNSEDPKEKVTKNDVIRMLREKVKELYEVQKVDIPIVNYKVDFIELSKTKEYEKYQILERVWLGDIVTIKHERLGINLKSKVISYKYDCISNRYIGLELGNFIKNIADNFSEQDKKLNIINNKIDTNVNNLKNALSETAKIIAENQGSLDKAIEDATNKLNNALGGHVVKKNDELLIMDTTNINTATKVWRWNMNGLGYSKNGYNGKYETAITMDGKIIGKFLQGEVLRGISIQGAEIVSVDNPNWNADDYWDFISTAKNKCRMNKGGLNFQSRDGLSGSWSDVECDINGWGITLKNTCSLMNSDEYGKGRMTISPGEILVSQTSEVSGGLEISAKKIFHNTKTLILDGNVNIKTESLIGRRRLGRVRQGNLPFSFEDVITWDTSSWSFLDLKNGWYNTNIDSYGHASWCIDSSGICHLQGVVSDGKVGMTVGSIPGINLTNSTRVLFFPVITNSGFGRVEIDRAGNVIYRSGSNGWVSLDNVHFKISI
ncbi:phage tail spike protein [Hathewaya histolytica]|uniref:phage tail spike protein n=1 Tax=Hathewaya histolytica TaxID=1498 RepID=UPI003B6832B2